MVSIHYSKGCRNCLEQGNPQFKIIQGHEYDWNFLTEYDAICMMERMPTLFSNDCKNCLSTNVEFLEIEVNGKKLYDFDKIDLRSRMHKESILQLKVSKSHSEIKFESSNSQNSNEKFIQASLHELISVLNSKSQSSFNHSDRGTFFICVTGGYDFDDEKMITRIERLQLVGIRLPEIIKTLEPFANEVGVRMS